MALAPAEPSATSSPASCAARVSAIAGGRVRLTTSRGGPSCAGARVAAGDALSVRARAGSATAAATTCPAIAERDVHGPVGATLLAELAGAVERIDDPDAVGAESDRVVGRLLGEHRVVSVGGGERGDDELVRRPVALGPEVGGIGAVGVHRRPQRDEQLARLGGDGGGVAVVGSGGGHRRRTLAARDGDGADATDETVGMGDDTGRTLRPWIAAAADVAVLVVFVVIGRRSHHEDAGVAGFLRVWWPFVVGLAVAWLVTGLVRSPLAWGRAVARVVGDRRRRDDPADRGRGA